MAEATIIRSPHAFVPKEVLTEEEREERYRTRIDESFKPYTVVDVLTKVYHRGFADDLRQVVGEHPDRFRKNQDDMEDWAVSNIWVNKCRLIRPESIFNQDFTDFKVDILVEAEIRIEEVRRGRDSIRRRYDIKQQYRLRNTFNLAPCKLICVFSDLVLHERAALISRPNAIRLDKYLLPVLKDEKDYINLAKMVIDGYYPQIGDKDVPVDPSVWVHAMGSKIYPGVFPEDGALGEYFFGFGTADVIDSDTGEVFEADINPGTVIINHKILSQPGMRNSTIAHEGSHKFLATAYFMLQRTHGHQYCSYMCKRHSSDDSSASHDKWLPVDIIEMQANKLPGYIQINQKKGKLRAERLLASYGGERNLENMKRLVDDMAEYYQTTKTMARKRLIDFGFSEVRGIMQSVNGQLVPPYLSSLKDNETYTISEAEGIREYIRNPKFREVIDSGQYVYVEGHYCLNDKRFVFTDRYGIKHLTMAAREDMAGCCLVFRHTFDNVVSRIINGVVRKDVGRGKKSIQYVDRSGKSTVTEEGIALREKMEKELLDVGVIRMSFNQMVKELMNSKKTTIQKLAGETGLSDETIKNLRNDTDRVFDIKVIAAFCIGLHLHPEVSDELIRISPSKFLNSVDMMLYKYALKTWYELPVAVVNRKLVEAGAAPLTNLVDGFDEDGVRLA